MYIQWGRTLFGEQVGDMYLISFVEGYVNLEVYCKGAVIDADCLHLFLSVGLRSCMPAVLQRVKRDGQSALGALARGL